MSNGNEVGWCRYCGTPLCHPRDYQLDVCSRCTKVSRSQHNNYFQPIIGPSTSRDEPHCSDDGHFPFSNPFGSPPTRRKCVSNAKMLSKLTLQAIRHINCGNGGTPEEVFGYIKKNHDVTIPKDELLCVIKDTLKSGSGFGVVRRNHNTNEYFIPSKALDNFRRHHAGHSLPCKKTGCCPPPKPCCPPAKPKKPKMCCPPPCCPPPKKPRCPPPKPKCPPPKPKCPPPKPKCPPPKPKCPPPKPKCPPPKPKCPPPKKPKCPPPKPKCPPPKPKCPPPKPKCPPAKPKCPKNGNGNGNGCGRNGNGNGNGCHRNGNGKNGNGNGCCLGPGPSTNFFWNPSAERSNEPHEF